MDKALAELPRECLGAVAHLLKVVTHDLNGALTPVTFEAYLLGEQAKDWAGGAEARAEGSRASEAEILSAAAQNLNQAANRVSDYLARIDQTLEDLRKADDKG